VPLRLHTHLPIFGFTCCAFVSCLAYAQIKSESEKPEHAEDAYWHEVRILRSQLDGEYR
jgi:hypothetical protein